jgi:hypothetical protein
MRCLVPQPVEVEVDRTNVISMFELAIHQVAPDEAAGAGDQDSHV